MTEFSVDTVSKIDQAKNFQSSGDFTQAEKLLWELVNDKQYAEEMLRELVQLYFQTGQTQQAINCLRELINKRPDELYYYVNLANVYTGLDQIEQAIDCYQSLVNRQPELATAHFNLALLYKKSKNYQQALSAYQQAIICKYDILEEVYTNISVIYSELRNKEQAEDNLKLAIKHNDNYLPAKYNLAGLFEEQGKQQQAFSLYYEILQFDPHYFNALIRLVNGQTISSESDPLVKKLKRALRKNNLEPLVKESLYFSLAKSYDDCGLYETAADCYSKGNQYSKQRVSPYNKQHQEVQTKLIIDTFCKQWFSQIKPVSTASPIFICGMFRSGSTLLEQVLVGHPLVTSAGEVNFLPELIHQEVKNFPLSISHLEQEMLDELGEQYLSDLKTLLPEAKNITDKRPENFIYIGLIKSLFPNAKIINTCREPMGNCLSIYFQQLSGEFNYANDLNDITHYYHQYVKLMEHWDTLFGNEIFKLNYEQLVYQPRQTVEKLLEYLQLDWSEECLDFQRRDNLVKTASIAQVREPLYTSSCERWKNYPTLVKDMPFFSKTDETL